MTLGHFEALHIYCRLFLKSYLCFNLRNAAANLCLASFTSHMIITKYSNNHGWGICFYRGILCPCFSSERFCSESRINSLKHRALLLEISSQCNIQKQRILEISSRSMASVETKQNFSSKIHHETGKEKQVVETEQEGWIALWKHF